MMLDYFYGQSGELFSYFRIPKALFQDSRFQQLSTDARTLYGILLDRMSLSVKNGWLDEQGRVYIIYTVREVQESLCCAEHKAVKLFRELEDIDLIERKRRGLGRPSLIYVKDFSSGLPKAQVQNCPNSNSGAAESAILEQPKPQANKTDKNKTEMNKPDPIHSGNIREQLEDYFYQVLEVDLLLRLCPDDEDTIGHLVELAPPNVYDEKFIKWSIVNDLIDQQLNDYPDEDIKATQERLNAAYDAFTAKYGLLNDRKNGRLFEQDSSYYLLCSLENLDEQGQLKSKAAMFTKRTIRPERTVTSVDTPSEALAVSIGEHGKVDLPYMAELLGTPGDYGRITTELSGVIFKDPAADPTDPEAGWQMADEYLSGDVRAKLRMAQFAAETNPEFSVNVDALTKAQPRELEASEIDVRLGATWLNPDIIQKFMTETFQIPCYLRHAVKVRYSPYTAEWRVEGKTATGRSDIISSETYGTSRANAYKILEETLNLKDVRIYDTIEDAEGKPKRVLNKRETMLAQQKQQVIKDAFANWVWQDPQRRIALVR